MEPITLEPAPIALAQEPLVTPRAWAAAAVIALGAMGVVLAWVPSRLFDLERFQVPKAAVLHMTALVLLALGAVPLRRSAWGRAGALLVAFVGWSAAAALLAENHWLAAEAWGISFSGTVLFLAARVLPAPARRIALIGVILAVVLGAGLGVAQAYGAEAAWLADSRPPGGTFGNRNFLAHLAAIAAPALLIGTLPARRRGAVTLALLGVGVLTAAVVLTRSRAAWLGALAGLACAAIGAWTTRRRDPSRAASPLPVGRIAAACGAVAAAIALAVWVPNRLEWTTETPYAATLGNLAEYQQGSGAGRLVQYRNSFALVPRDPLLGVGPGNWFVHYPRVTTGRRDPAYAAGQMIPTNPWPSSDWVALVVERGAIGAALLLLAGLAVLAAALRGAGGRADPGAAAAVAGILAATVVCGAFDAVLLLPAPSFLVLGAVGLLVPPVASADPAPTASRPGPRLAATTAALALVLLTGAHATAIDLTAESTRTTVLARAARWAPGEHRLRLTLGERGRCADARAAGRLMPYHERVKRLVERCG